MMNYSKVISPVWADKGQKLIDCVVTFEIIGVVPFTASQQDNKDSLEIFNRCMSGEFGPIAEYIEPTITPAQNQPATSGTQTL